MKNIFIILLITISTSLFADPSVYELVNQADNIKYQIQDNSRLLQGRRNTQKRIQIEQALRETHRKIENILSRRGGGNGGGSSIDTLTRIQEMCNSINNWSGRATCYRNSFQGSRDHTSAVISSCSAITSSENTSRCFSSAISKAVERSDIETIARSGCDAANSWVSRASCYKQLSVVLTGNDGQVAISSGCTAISSSENLSRCYSAGLSASSDRNNASSIIKKSCDSANSWTSRAPCYDAAVYSIKGYNRTLQIIYNSCSQISSSESKSRCYSRGL